MYLCYHHTDMDGKGAGDQVYRYILRQGVKPLPSMFIMRGYDEPYSEDDYNQKEVFIVDLSFTKANIKKLFDICEGANKVTWIDHHFSSVECVEDDDIRAKLDSYHNLTYFINTKACGAVLSYLILNDVIDMMSFDNKECIDYEIETREIDSGAYTISVTNPDGEVRTVAIPDYLVMIDKYDRWVYGDDDRPLLFNYGTQTRTTNVFAFMTSANEVVYNHRFWQAVMNPHIVKQIIDDGKLIKTYFEKRAKSSISANAYEAMIGGHKALVVNSTESSSLLFGDKVKEYDLVCIWKYNGKIGAYNYSLYSDKPEINCAKICQKYDPNGGGHPGAAGFSSDKLLFKKDN